MRFPVGEKVEIRTDDYTFHVGIITARREDLQLYCVELHDSIKKLVIIDRDSHIRLPTTPNSINYYCSCWTNSLPCEACESSSKK